MSQVACPILSLSANGFSLNPPKDEEFTTLPDSQSASVFIVKYITPTELCMKICVEVQ